MADDVLCEDWRDTKRLDIDFPKIKLLRGKYHFALHVADEEGKTILFAGNIMHFEITNKRGERGMVKKESAVWRKRNHKI